ncbi:carrier protein (macronuclear) [Tetrahymena thermophila SB210]|uniref:Carrier protein n=1 Tax=Tetrahymena thermophila (strain SB210) TaxID=312017 RepID=I7MJ61_TETTS|nr:carrier protein [Tetrahymena thermophila SB210]EAR95993.1 carrier protein [Tetrahymena thermophila SB210]|eukprot:XP_001016238.1 carrier protein [Tetrahymena thermophila SB210]
MSDIQAQQVELTQEQNGKKFSYSNTYLKEFGVLGYLALQAVLYPIERIKVLQQVDIIPEVTDEAGKYDLRQNFQNYYNRHAESETFEAFYRGLGAKICKLITKELSIYFLADRIRDRIQVFDPKEDPFKHFVYNFISGVTSGTLTELIAYPMEVAKTRILCDGAPFEDRIYTNAYEALFKDSSARIYRGALFSLTGAALYRGTQIGLYETLNQLGMKDMSAWVHLPASILITIYAQKITYPFDTIRRQVMLRDTPFEVTSAETDTIIKRLTHPARRSDLMRGWNMQLYKSVSAGIFLFGYKALSGTFQAAPDLITKFSH